MKSKLSLLLVCLLSGLHTISQTITPKPGVQLAPNVAGYYEYLPKGYDGVKKFPLILFLHGLGNSVNQGAPLSSLVAKGNGLMSMLADGSVPDQGMVVIAPQFGSWPAPEQSLQVINKAIELYRIDTTRIYVTGLSMGGGATWEVAALAGKRIAAIAPVCGASSPDQNRIRQLVAAQMPILAFHAQGDPTVPAINTHGYVDGVNALSISPKAIKYIYQGDFHNIWGDSYLEYQGIYNFFRQYNRPAAVVVNPLPELSLFRISASETPPMGWVSDRSFVTAQTGWWATMISLWGKERPISGTQNPGLYSLERWGDFEYKIPVSPGIYQVKMHFAEIWHSKPGQRVFNVDIEGQRVLPGFDILSIVPRFTAIQRTFEVTVNDGVLNIELSKVSDYGKITAVEVTPKALAANSIIYLTQYKDSATGAVLLSRTDTFKTNVVVTTVIK
jgi:predicted esterase